MNPREIARVETYLQSVFNNSRIKVVVPKKDGAPVEVTIDDEFIGVLHKDEEDSEVSYSLHMTILEEDLSTVSTA